MALITKTLATLFLAIFMLIVSTAPSFAASESPVSSIRSVEGITVGDDFKNVSQMFQTPSFHKKWQVDSNVPYLTKLSARSNYSDEGGYHSRSFIEIGTTHAQNVVLSTTYKIIYRSGGIMYSSYLKHLIKTATQNFGEPRYENVYVTINKKLTPINAPYWKQGKNRLHIVTYKVPNSDYPYILEIQRDRSIF